ncbi:MAG: PGPGW domain-containing protein [Gammaproteobacteria bacterium]|nr:PGPGW domain-containing protein [Gammaproteobacteria bacterium]
MLEWLQTYEYAYWWLFAFSLLTFFGTLIAVPMLLVRIPRDYFAHEKRERLTQRNHNILSKTFLVVIKNAIGCVLVFMGIIMLFTPGQGIITILVGLMLLNYPGKYRLERWIVSRPAVFRTINWLRRRARREPLVL